MGTQQLFLSSENAMHPQLTGFVAKEKFLAFALVSLLVIANVVWWNYESGRPHAEAGKLSNFNFLIGGSDQQAKSLQSLVYLPSSYESDGASKRWPVVMFLHGSWHRGDDLDLVRQSGLPKLIEEGNEFPFIMVAPQCPREQRWHTKDLFEVLDEVEKQFRVDKDRIHVTGFELGGYATWDLAAENPERFATAVPFGGHRPKSECQGPAPEWMSRVHLWHLYALSDEVTDFPNATGAIHNVWDAGSYVRLTDLSEGSRVLWHDWTTMYDRVDVLKWMLEKRRKTRYLIRWENGPPQPGKQVWGELCERQPGEAGKPLVGFWLYQPPGSKHETPIRAPPLIMFLHGSEHAGSDSQQVLESPLPRAIEEGMTPPFLVVSPQCRADSAWDLSLLEELLDRLDVELAIDPHRQFLTGAGEGARATWDFAVIDPSHFLAIAPIGYQPGPNHQQTSHRLCKLNKWFFSKDNSIESAIEYYKLVAETRSPPAAPLWTIIEEESVNSLATRVYSNGDLFDWFLEQEVTRQNAERPYTPNGIPSYLQMASPEVVALFRRYEYKFQDHHQQTKPFVYRLHTPSNLVEGKTYPLVIWLHGHGDSELRLEAGELQWTDHLFPDPQDSESHNFFAFALQCPFGRSWFDNPVSSPGELKSDEPITAVMEVKKQICLDHPIDEDRVSLIGISSGSSACWEVLKRYPGHFAAIAPIAGGGSRVTNYDGDLSGERIWAFKGLVDGDVDGLRETIRNVRALGADVRFTEVLRDAHYVWSEAFFEHRLLSWLLEQRRN